MRTGDFMNLATKLLTALVIAMGAAASAQAEYAPRGTYQRTCSDIEATWNTLSATCRTRTGSWNYSTLRNYRDCDGDIANRNGRLECIGSYNEDGDDDYRDRLPMGSYRDSCRKMEIERGTLTAECQDNFGRWRYTELAGYGSCRDIANSNGILRCIRKDYDDGDDNDDSGDGRLPGGSWRYSCQNGRVYGSVLYATCRDGSGSWRASTLDLRNCRYNVVNENGRLVCGGSGGGGGNSRITLYRHTNYAGLSRTFSTDIPDLGPYSFGNLTSSVVIQGGIWQLCDKPNYRGYCVILDRSQTTLWAFGFNDRTESIRRVR